MSAVGDCRLDIEREIGSAFDPFSFTAARQITSVCDPLGKGADLGPSLFNDSLITTGQAELERLPTVIITKKSTKYLKVNVDESSPLITSGELKALGSAFLNEISPEPGSGPAETPLSSSILHPIKYTGLNKTNSIFREIEASAKAPTTSSSSGASLVPSTKLIVSSRATQGKKKLIILAIVVFITILIGGLIPSIYFSVHGSSFAVKNYLGSLTARNRQILLHDLVSKYSPLLAEAPGPDLITNHTGLPVVTTKHWDRMQNRAKEVGAKLAGFNTFDGINPAFKHDKKIEELMSINKNGTIFYGIAYSPRNALEPACGLTKQDIVYDLALLSTVTTRIRTYGMQCNQASMILDTIQEMRLNMTVSVGVWIGSTDTINLQQLRVMEEVVSKYPGHLFESIFIGNEVLFREDKTTNELVSYIHQTKAMLLRLNKGFIPVGTSEIGSLINTKLLDSCDIIGANIHPFFGGGDVKYATNWIYDFLKYQISPLYTNETNQATVVITEVGWPYKGGQFLSAKADTASFQAFMNTYICEAYKHDYGWYYFEGFDEPWKSIFYENGNKWETEWGVFNHDRSLKPETWLPQCP